MKPWLLDILACPIDKHFPLDLYIFSYETNEEEFKEILSFFEKRDIDLIKKENIIEIHEEKGEIYIRDDIVIEKSLLNTYLNLIISSIKEVNYIHDKSSSILSKQCFNIIKHDIKDKITHFSNNLALEQIENILPELYFLNKIKIETEVETGLLFCSECMRWYPIIETIPQMLPDEYRDQKAAIQFLKTNKDLLDNAFFKQNLKPFNV
jgi:uncharacterized protein YbaR (Trm112 family)